MIESPNISRSERLAKQRKHLKSRLGLGGPVDILDSADLIKDEDLVITSAPAPSLSSANSQQKDASAVISEMAGMWQGICTLLMYLYIMEKWKRLYVCQCL